MMRAAPEKTEFYVHDAQGNPLTIYSYLASETPTYKVNEQMIYGSSRLGLWKSDVDLLAYIPEVPEVMTVDRGNRRYEMNDHLSNVHTVVTDRRKRICEEETFSHYEADIQSTYDYYAFGMMMPGRGFSQQPMPCTPDTTFAVSENFGSSTGGFTALGSNTTISNGSTLLEISYSLPPLMLANSGGAAKTFGATSGNQYYLGFISVVPCSTMGTRDIPGVPYPVAVTVKDENGTVVITQSFPTPGAGSLSFTAASSGTYTVEFWVSGNACTYYIDDVYLYSVTSCPGDGQPNISDANSSYRFGFNGKEHDKEGMGGGVSTYDYGFRIYNPQIARFLSVDPLTGSYPWYTPYQFAGNKPTSAIDIDGLEEYVVVRWYDQAGKYNGSTAVRIRDERDRLYSNTGIVYLEMEDNFDNRYAFSESVRQSKAPSFTYTGSSGSLNSGAKPLFEQPGEIVGPNTPIRNPIEKSLINSARAEDARLRTAGRTNEYRIPSSTPGGNELTYSNDVRTLNDLQKGQLDAEIDFLNQNPDYSIDIVGTASTNNGTAISTYNQDIAADRARIVTKYMTDNGVDPSKISTGSVGDSRGGGNADSNRKVEYKYNVPQR
jgi:RHS repeat-associated protein